MVQATNELILGIDLNERYAQITYYHQSVREPLTLGGQSNPEQFQLPMGLRQNAGGDWKFWDGEPLEDGEEPDRARISGLYERVFAGGPVETEDGSFEPEELLSIYFSLCRDSLKLLSRDTQLHVMVTVRSLTEAMSGVIVRALERAGVERRLIYVQDYSSSFYYYTVNQRRELWYQDVALLEYIDGEIVGSVLHIDRSTRPAIARVDVVARQPVGGEERGDRSDQEWNRELDRLFFELLKKVFERRTISVSYLIGDFFNKSWAERSIQFLCYKRHAFQGKNLFSKGACYAAMERAGLAAGRDILFGGQDMIEVNIGMEMRIRGKETYYPLVTAGVNWYEAHHVCEFIPQGERELRVISRPMSQGESVVHMMRLPGLPSRPDRATRLRLTVSFSSPGRCVLEVEDLGFGGFFRSSGMSWTRTIDF